MPFVCRPGIRQTMNLQLAMLVHGHVWEYATIGAFAGVYLFYRGFRMLQRKRLIENTPSSRIRSASMGLVEVSGLATGPYTINAPITGLPCYLHRTIAWEWKREGKNSQWVKVADETQHVPFFLDDNTGRVLVDPQGAEMQIHRDFCDEFNQSLFSSSLETPANVANFFSYHGVDGNHKTKVEEYSIKPKNALFVLGTLAENHGTAASAIPRRTVAADAQRLGFRFSILRSGVAPGTGFTLGAGEEVSPVAASEPALALDSAQSEKVAAALRRAGIANPAAWAAAGIPSAGVSSFSSSLPSGGAAAAAAPVAEKTPEVQFDLQPPVVLMKGVHNPAFFISWQSQREVVGSLGWKSAAMIWGGPALTLGCIYLVAQFGWL
jgi:E3 Ubiquitin ligase